MESIKLEQASIKSDFIEHLNLDGNNRIIFTAPFGSGKSTLLKEVFDGNLDEYFTLKLFPINYSVSQNEDVFELIKFDLILQLMGFYTDEIKLAKEDFTALLTSQVYINERMKVMPLINALLNLSGKIGKSAVDLIKVMDKTIADLKEFQEEIMIDEEEDLKVFLRKMEARPGHAYEMDEVSSLIADLIRRVKQADIDQKISQKQSVLIIDDLDRLDPEHTFRLFNIFSAHFDDLDAGNKFGFDKVVFVCDVDNIRKLYRHKYGVDVDFEGYLNKFYSYYPFEFDNRKYVKEKMHTFIKNIKTIHNSTGEVFSHLTKPDNKHDFFYIIRWMLLSLVDAKLINLRTLTTESPYNIPEYFFYGNNETHKNSYFHILILFNLLKLIFTSNDVVREKLFLLNKRYNSQTIQKASEHENYNYTFLSCNIKSICLPFLLPPEIGLKRNFSSADTLSAYSNSLKVWLHFKIDNSSLYKDKLVFEKAIIGNDVKSQFADISNYQFLLACFDDCLKIGAIR